MSQELTRPLIGIENRTPQEVFDIMCDRIRMSGIETQLSTAQRQLEEAREVIDDLVRTSIGPVVPGGDGSTRFAQPPSGKAVTRARAFLATGSIKEKVDG